MTMWLINGFRTKEGEVTVCLELTRSVFVGLRRCMRKCLGSGDDSVRIGVSGIVKKI